MKTAEFESEIPRMQEKIHQLRAKIAAHPFAKGLSAEHLDTLAECAMETQFAAGEQIFREGEFANRFYFLLEGEVTLEGRGANGPVPIETIGAGDVLGWSWLFPPCYWHFQARAERPTQAIFFYGTWLREQCEQDHGLGYELMKRTAEVMIGRLQATRMQLSAALADKPQAVARR